MGRVNIEIPDEKHKQAKIHCAINDISLKEFIIQAVIEKLERESNEKKK
ncbi:3-hydroxyacyl-CoA dehydrogenase [Nanoarchaeota archaeon]